MQAAPIGAPKNAIHKGRLKSNANIVRMMKHPKSDTNVSRQPAPPTSAPPQPPASFCRGSFGGFDMISIIIARNQAARNGRTIKLTRRRKRSEERTKL